MQAGHRCPHPELRSHQAHAADSAGGSAQQGHYRVDTQHPAAEQAHHQARDDQAEGDHHRRAPELAQLRQRRAGEPGADHGADADLQERAAAERPLRCLQVPGHAQQSCSQQSAGERGGRDAGA